MLKLRNHQRHHLPKPGRKRNNSTSFHRYDQSRLNITGFQLSILISILCLQVKRDPEYCQVPGSACGMMNGCPCQYPCGVKHG